MHKLLSITLTLLALAPTCLRAADAPAAPAAKTTRNADILEPVWQELEGRVSTLIGKEKQHAMVDLAYAEVAADVCKTMVVEKKTYFDDLSSLITDTKTKRSPEEQVDFEHNVMVYLGVYIGLIVAESHMDSGVFCQDAQKAWTEKRGPGRLWTAAPATTTK